MMKEFLKGIVSAALTLRILSQELVPQIVAPDELLKSHNLPYSQFRLHVVVLNPISRVYRLALVHLGDPTIQPRRHRRQQHRPPASTSTTSHQRGTAPPW